MGEQVCEQHSINNNLLERCLDLPSDVSQCCIVVEQSYMDTSRVVDQNNTCNHDPCTQQITEGHIWAVTSLRSQTEQIHELKTGFLDCILTQLETGPRNVL